MSKRFFVDEPIRGRDVVLAGPEAQHAAKVMRIQPGNAITLFDGSGSEFEAVVRSVDRSNVACEVRGGREVCRELSTELVLLSALPKGERQRWLIEKAVEMGVRRFVPLVTDRSVVRPTDAAIRRLKRSVIEASKQCGRNRLMEIAPSETLSTVKLSQGTHRVLAHPNGTSAAGLAGLKGPFCLAIGPEGGFAPDEVQRAQEAGWQMVSLGPRILRVETAAIALTSLLSLVP